MKTKAILSSYIVFNILRSWLLLYAIYYSVGALVFAIYRLENFDGTIPFDFLTWVDLGNCCSYSSQQMVNMISMFVTFTICGAVYGFYIENRVWDYAVTVSILHMFACCFVMLNFPVTWSWWLCLGISCLLMTGCGEVISFLWRYRDSQRQIEPVAMTAEQDLTGSYLHKTKR